MLFKSLICFRGFDRGWRHLAISVAAYLLLMLVWLLFGNGYFIWLPGSLLAVVVIASALRRVRDARQTFSYGHDADIALAVGVDRIIYGGLKRRCLR
ncbi:hypothetical protein KHX94_10130 [Shewanella dokdonensis]|uniref:Uncharacterized protein n=1 Tax=Shewanella dokdonensis TaxID=712036 RepID=A0ABX8DAG7_9GAMM|nr:hypothetical protein [Shewanella dokdonensis]QVK21893.1 hypothetical protein KHX94_10130 [Shewanella dokdonensis]